VVHLHPILVVVGRQSSEHFEEEDTEAVEIDHSAVALVGYHLRAHVLRAATERLTKVFNSKIKFRKAKICQFKVAINIDQDVLRL